MLGEKRANFHQTTARRISQADEIIEPQQFVFYLWINHLCDSDMRLFGLLPRLQLSNQIGL